MPVGKRIRKAGKELTRGGGALNGYPGSIIYGGWGTLREKKVKSRGLEKLPFGAALCSGQKRDKGHSI